MSGAADRVGGIHGHRPFSIALLASVAPLWLAAASCGSLPSSHATGTAVEVERDVRRFGAVGDGVVDDTDAIQRAVDSGAGQVRFRRGRYRITRPIDVDLAKGGVRSIDGDGTATIVMDGPGPALRFVGTHEGTASPSTVEPNVWERERAPMVDGVEIVGAHQEADGIEARGTMQLTVTRVVIRRARHGIRLVERNRNVLISSCHVYENRGAGIFYDHVNLHQSNITGCHISYNGGGGIVVRGGDVRNVQINGCDVEGNMDAAGEPTANVLLDATGGSIGEVVIAGCTIQHDHNAPGSANIRVEGTSTARAFTEELRHGNITIADNVLSDVQINVDLANARGVTVTGNTMWKGYTHDVRVVGSASVVIAGNVFDRNPRYHYGDGADARGGIVLEDSSDSTLAHNQLLGTGNTEAAVLLRRCRRLNVTSCSILDVPNVGLRLEDVNDSRVSDCIIRTDRADRVYERAERDSGDPSSLEVAGGSGNMIVDNLLDVRPRIDEGAGHAEGNVYP